MSVHQDLIIVKNLLSQIYLVTFHKQTHLNPKTNINISGYIFYYYTIENKIIKSFKII